MEDIELRAPVRDEVLVEVAGVGLCHTDVAGRHLLGGAGMLPAVLGHEGAGIVVDAGPEAGSVAVGDHVVLSFDSCTRCTYCLSGRPSSCVEFGDRNLRGHRPETPPPADGLMASWFAQSSFASHALVREHNVVRVAADLPLELLGPFGCGFQTGAGTVMNSMDVGVGSRLVVFGVGAVGLSAVMASAIVGAERTVAVDLHLARLDLARGLGAITAAGSSPDLVDDLMSICPEGFTHAIDTTGNPTVIANAMSVLSPRGHCGMVGAIGGPIVLPPRAFRGGQNLSYVFEGDSVPQVFIPQLIELWRQGRFPFEELVAQYGLDQLNEAEQETNAGDVVKAILIP